MYNKFWKNKVVLITGHEGFVGSWLTRSLVNLGASIIGLDKVVNCKGSLLNEVRNDIIGLKVDIVNLNLINKVIEEYKPKVVFHLAAEATVGEAQKNPVKAFKTNIEGTWNILEALRDKDYVESVIVTSSDKAYGNHKKLPYFEDAALRGSSPYDVSKSCADLLSYAYFSTFGLPVCVTRCGNIYGPGDFHLSRIVPDAVLSSLSRKELLIRSDGSFIRDYVYIEDIIAGFIILAEKMNKSGLAGQAFNFSNEKPVSVLELVKLISKLIGIVPAYKILNQAKHEIKTQYLSSKKAERILGWKAKHTLEQGLIKTIAWYKLNFK